MMDELIRELESAAASGRSLRDRYPIGSEGYEHNDGMATAYADSVKLAREAKRRMADRELAWNLNP